jgi:chromosome segregation ATPase
MQSHLTMVNDLTKAKESADSEIQRCRAEMKELESEVVRAQTDLTVVRAELDGAYGTRAQRAADVSMNPAIQKEIDDLNDSNIALQRQIDFLKSEHQDAGAGSEELQSKVELLQKELKETIEDYELMTRASIEFEKERDQLESQIDSLRERGEALEAQLSDEKLKWLGVKNGGPGQGGPTESTSTMILKNEFKKMMRDTRAENMKALRVGSLSPLRLYMLTTITG